MQESLWHPSITKPINLNCLCFSISHYWDIIVDNSIRNVWWFTRNSWRPPEPQTSKVRQTEPRAMEVQDRVLITLGLRWRDHISGHNWPINKDEWQNSVGTLPLCPSMHLSNFGASHHRKITWHLVGLSAAVLRQHSPTENDIKVYLLTTFGNWRIQQSTQINEIRKECWKKSESVVLISTIYSDDLQVWNYIWTQLVAMFHQINKMWTFNILF